MSRKITPDIAALYHQFSSNVRVNLPDIDIAYDDRPVRLRTYPGARRVSLGGRDLAFDVPFGNVLRNRRSIRDFVLAPLPLEFLGHILYGSYGIHSYATVDGEWVGRRCVPSAGGLYPLEIYVAAQAVEAVSDGLWHYDPRAHELELCREGNFHDRLAELTIGQDMIRQANLVFILTAIVGRTMWKYGQRGYRYVWLDAGHVGQNLYLLAAALGLGAVAIGGFFDREVSALMLLAEGEHPIYLFCVGQRGSAPGF